VNSELNQGLTVIAVTFIMGVVWGLVYKKTFSLRWVIFAHFLIDIFNLSAASFLDLYDKGSW
jgi:membrane protease YdiL (CAAX protease family)